MTSKIPGIPSMKNRIKREKNQTFFLHKFFQKLRITYPLSDTWDIASSPLLYRTNELNGSVDQPRNRSFGADNYNWWIWCSIAR